MQKRLHFAYFIITFILLIFVFLLLLTVTNFIPKQALFRNFKISVSQIAEYETMNQKTPQLFEHYQLDYHTDAIMLDNAYFVDAEKPIKAALSCPSFGGSMDNLYSVTMNPDIAPSKTYSRYWHGYLILLRPMLIFLDYFEIGKLNTYIFYLLLGICLLKLYKKIGGWFSLVFLVSIISLNIATIPINTQYMAVFIISFIAIWATIALYNQKREWIPLLFMVTGMSTMYFDFFTSPILTFGFPIIVYVVLMSRENTTTFKSLMYVFLACFTAWTVGYVLTWVVKIVLAYLVVGSAELGYALESFSLRMAREIPAVTAERITEGIHAIIPSMSVDHLPLLCVSIGLVVMQLFNPVNLVVLGSVFILGLVLRLTHRKLKKSGIAVYSLLIISLIPIVWFAIAVNPTIIHYYFQYRTIGVTVFGVLSAVYVGIDFSVKGKKKRQQQ